MKYGATYDGIDLSKFCHITKISREILPPRSNFSKNIPSMNGSYYTGFKYGEREISIDIYIDSKNEEDYNNKILGLSNLLNVDSPKKMTISTEKDKYMYSIIDGTTKLEKLILTGSTTLNFICYDPVMYSDNWDTFTPNERKIINLENTGTYYTYPVIDVTFRKSACFFQITNRNGETVLIGKPKELNKPIINESDVVISDNCENKSTFTTLSSTLLPNGYEAGGEYGVGHNGNGIVCTNYGSGNNWHGTAFRRSLNSNVSEFEVAINIVASSHGKNYTPPPPQPLPPVAPKPPTGETTSLGQYKVVNCGGLWINREANTNNPLYAMAPNTIIYPTEIKGNWYKHTHKNRWGTVYTGWSYGKYLQKVSNNGKMMEDRSTEYAEEQIGRIEVFGFDKNGSVLFRQVIGDSSEWFEAIRPEVYIGSTKVLDENPTSGKTIRKEKKDGSDQTQNAASGAVGRFNDITGKLIIKREKNSKGQYLWTASVNKYIDGKLSESLSTNNSLCNSKYPTGDLNYLGFFIGSYGSNAPMSVLTVTHISVKKLNVRQDSVVGSNISLFREGDELQINFQDSEILRNGLPIMNEIDIGSNFFSIPVGRTDIITRSDDDTAIVCAGIQKRFL